MEELMNLESLIQAGSQGQGQQPQQPQQPSAPQTPPSTPVGIGSPNTSPGVDISDVVKQMPASGLKKVAGSVWALFSKISEAMLPLYGLNTPEGKKVASIIKQMNSLTEGATASDIGTAIKSLMQALPPNLQGLDINGIIGMFQNQGGAKGMPPGMPPLPQGAQPPQGAQGAGLEQLLQQSQPQGAPQ